MRFPSIEGVGDASADAVAVGDAAGVALGDAVGDGVARGVGVGVGVGLGVGVGMRVGVAVGTITGSGVGVDAAVTIGVGDAIAARSSPRCANAETSAPIPRPATMTPNASATVDTPPERARFFGGAERRRGDLDTTQRTFGRAASSRLRKMNRERATRTKAVMIRVPVPIDIGAVGASAAFALATPLSLEALIDLALRQALGPRAPEEKHRRTLAVTLEGIRDGRFIVEVDGRRFDSPERVVVCSGHANLRFFHAERARS